jgi:hypothetical protein
VAQYACFILALWNFSRGVDSLSIGFADYSSANLLWSEVQGALGYNIYLNDQLAASIPSVISMTSITIGGLEPGTSNSFYVKAIGAGGAQGSQSPTVEVTTKALPGGSTVANLGMSAGSTSSSFLADVLVPYAFIRLYLWDTVTCDFDANPGWPINFIPSSYVCTHYMVEGSTLYKYSGVVPPDTTNAPFSWTKIGDVPVTVTDHYTYHWTLLFGTSTVDPREFVVQAQGYNPFTNMFKPDKDDYDCKGPSICGDSGAPQVCDKIPSSMIDDKTYTNQQVVPNSPLSFSFPPCFGYLCRVRALVEKYYILIYSSRGSASDTGTSARNTLMISGYGLFIQGSGVCTISGTELRSAF